ncbi:hypothetical protein D3C85_267450 [compost metagenome]
MNPVKFLLFLLLFSNVFYAQNDCKDAIVVCGNTGFQGLNARGAGAIVEYDPSDKSCFAQENNSIWLKLSIKTPGTLGFILTPENKDLNVDFDFVVFGPTATCNSLANSIRCSTTNPAAAKLQNNTTGMTGQHSDIAEGPGSNGDDFVQWLTVTAGQTYFIAIDRFFGDSNFSLEWLGTATFDDPPSLNVPAPGAIDLEESDFSGNENPIVDFNLTKNTLIITGSQSDVTVTYHISSNDAIINSNAIENPAAFKNSTNPQTIYTRITNNKTNCYNWTSFNLIISDKLTIKNTIYEICDNSDTDAFDGKAKFDLNQVTTSILENQNIPDLSFKYYLSQNDAIDDINALSNDFYNTIPFQQSVFIKISNNKSSVLIKEIKLIVNPLPKINDNDLVQCDSRINADGFVLFNLKEANATLTDNNPDLETSFFTNNSDALNNTQVLNTTYKNISNPQILFVRVTNSKTKCYTISELTLKANVISETTYTLDAACDDDGLEDGIHLFDLTKAQIPFTPTQNIHYFPNENDALLEQNEIATPSSYQNETPYNQFVFARIEEENNCYGISKIKLEVNKLPDIETNATTNVCENNTAYKAHLNTGLINNQSNDFSYVWSKDGVTIPNEISPTLEANQIGIYTVIITNKSNCSKTRTIEVSESSTATIENVDIIDLLVDNSNKITINVSGKGDYEYSLNTPNGPFQESNIFENVVSGSHEIYINDKKNCGLINKTVAVLGAPNYFTPNSDGYHDYWNIIGLNTDINKNAIIFIYDRYGKLLKQIHPSDLGWDGTFVGNPLPSDDYWYTLKLEDNREAKGHFSLKR